MARISIPPGIEKLATEAVDAAFAVHRELGPGLLESAYETCFKYELEARGRAVQTQVPVPLTYRDKPVEVGFRADVVIDGQLLVELKSVEGVLPVHKAQVITYLKLMRLPLGLLINFNESLIKDGIHRILNLHLLNTRDHRG